MADVSRLLELVKEKYEISPAEEKLFRDTVNGEIVDYSAKDTKIDNPAEADGWGDERILRASRIAWLCTDKQASQFITHHGIQVKGARIDEKLDLLFSKIPFPLYFEQCKFTTQIDLRHAQIAALYMPGTHTGQILAGGLKAEGPLFLRHGFKAEGEVMLLGATVGGDLDCKSSQFINRDGKALSADRLKVEGTVFLSDGFAAEGEVRLLGAMLGGNLVCANAQVVNEDGSALLADGLRVEGTVFLRDGFKAVGEVCMLGATIGGDLDCLNGQFINKDRRALNADRLKVGGSVFLRDGFRAEGEVRLVGAMIGVDLDCGKGQFINKNGKALNADGLKVKGHVFLRKGFMADGTVSFVGATVDKHFFLESIDSPEQVTLDLATANIGTLHDKEDSWPPQNHLVLHGLEYKEISHESPRNSETRIEWLQLQKGFGPQPYEQLAKVLRESGDDAGAKDVLIAKNTDKAKRTKLTRSQWLWYRLLGPRIGYGHRPLIALPWALALILVGWGLFAIGYSGGLITPPGDSAYTTTEKLPVPDPGDGTKGISTAYPVFNSLVYSIDVFVPVVDFHQANDWLPNANRGSKLIKIGPWPLHTGGLLLFWLWVETVLGWVLSTLFIVGLTGLVRT